jgi:hypothetical protein
VPALVELTSGHTGQDLLAAGATEVTVPPAHFASRVCSVTIGPGFLPLMRTNPALGAMIERVELALPVTSTRSAPAAGAATPTPRALPAQPGGRTVLGVIDDGCAIAHRSLRGPVARQTRVAWLWDQNAVTPAFTTAGTVPADLGYGQEYPNHVLEDWMNAATHGGVLDIATGPVRPAARLDPVPRSAAAPSPPPAPHVIFVPLPQAALGAPSGGWLAAHVTDGVRYIPDRTPTDTTHIVVNLSYDSRVGPHDGTSTLEAALLEMLDKNPTLEIVLPAGNFFADRAHAVLEVPGGPATARIETFVPPGSELPVFVELWLPHDAAPVSAGITPPSAPTQASGYIGPGTAQVWPATAQPACTVVYPSHSTLAAQGTCILLVFAPTAPRNGGRTPAPAGRWTIELQADAATVVHGYIARSDADFGMPRRGGRPLFVPDANYDPQRHLRRARDDLDARMPGPPSNVKRRGTLARAAVHSPDGGPAADEVGGAGALLVSRSGPGGRSDDRAPRARPEPAQRPRPRAARAARGRHAKRFDGDAGGHEQCRTATVAAAHRGWQHEPGFCVVRSGEVRSRPPGPTLNRAL